MPAETTSRRRGNDKYTVVFLPSDQTKKSRSFSVNLIGIVASILGTICLIVGAVLVLVIFTPVGAHLPISSTELEQRYGQRVSEIQRSLTSLVREVAELRSYNQRLRQALGENSSRNNKGLSENESSSKSKDSKSLSSQHTKSPVEKMTVMKPSPETVGSLPMNERVSGRVAHDEIHQFPLTMPVIGYQTRDYNDEQYHVGIDLVASEGSPVVAAASGRVIFADWTYDDGFMVILTHGDGFTTVYKHNKTLLKNRGDVVKRGETIALLGNTGSTSSGPHLHFEVWNNGIALNPLNYIITIQ